MNGIIRTRIKGPKMGSIIRLGEDWFRTWDGKWVFNYAVSVDQRNAILEQAICRDETHKGPPYRTGGPFHLVRRDNRPYLSKAYNLTALFGGYKYKGKFCGLYGNVAEISSLFNTYNTDTAYNYGATAWNRFRPTKPKLGVAQFIGELRDFKSLFKVRLRSFQDLGGAYLNYQFGWKPFLGDLYKFITSQSKIEKTIQFIRKNNNKWITRGGTMDNEITCVTTQYPGLTVVYPGLNTAFHSSSQDQPPTSYTITESNRVWFKARMKYYIRDLTVDKADNVWNSRLLRQIYGANITPDLLWELTPWSWLADWFGNIGDILANLSNQYYDDLTAKYAYVMRARSKSWEISQPFVCSTHEYGRDATLFTAKSYQELVSKERAAASPFGFGISWENFSNYQLSILAALGLTRLH